MCLWSSKTDAAPDDVDRFWQAYLRRFDREHTFRFAKQTLGWTTPDLNPQEGIWSLVRRDIGNLAAADLARITRAVKRGLKMTQYRPHLIDGCLAGTGMTLDWRT